MRILRPFTIILLTFSTGLLVHGSSELRASPACSVDVPDNPWTVGSYADETALEQELLSLTNQYRAHRGLGPLIADEALARLARNHSREMAAQGFISHRLSSGDTRTRLIRAGYPHQVLRENIASAPTVLSAHKALVASPGHERNILADDVTRVGIGVVHGGRPCERQLYITEIFARPHEELHEAAVHEMLLNRFSELGLPPSQATVRLDPLLEKITSRTVDGLKVAYDKGKIERILADSARELQQETTPLISRISLDVQLVHNPQHLKIPIVARKGPIAAFGSAVRKVFDSGNQPALLVLTLIAYAGD